MPVTDHVDFASPAFKAEGHSYYARLRDERPVCQVTVPDGWPAWLVTPTS